MKPYPTASLPNTAALAGFKIAVLVLAVMAGLFNSGCVVGRRTVALPIPATGGSGPAKGEMFVGDIADNRHFENKPANPAIPSIDGDVHGISAEQKATMIGRQRNTYGKAMGDIALPANDSVKQRARLLFEEGLKSRGYKVTPDANAANAAEISIDEFWAWFSPGMWSVSFEARVRCTVTIRRSGEITKFSVLGYGKNQGQMASDENWQLAYSRAFADFLLTLEQEMNKAGL